MILSDEGDCIQMSLDYSNIDTQILSGLMELSEPGEDSLIDELLGIFESTTPELLASLEVSIRQQEAARTQSIAHRLKGAAANIGARAMAQTCSEIEQQAKSGDHTLDVNLCLKAATLFKSACTEIRRWQKDHSAPESY